MPKGSSQASSLRKCCSANISVGAINAHCQPASMQTAAASAATTVFPAPTSPCSKRCIGVWRAMSKAISSLTRACAPVRANGRAACRRWRSAPGVVSGSSTGARKAARARRACNCESCCASSSSAFRRCQAGWLWSIKVSMATSGRGWCKNASASCKVHKPPWACGLRGLRSPGAKVSDSSARARPPSTALRK